MADKTPDEPNLELPSFGLGRLRRSRKDDAEAPAEPETATESETSEPADDEPTQVVEPDPEPDPQPTETIAPEPDPEPDPEPTQVIEPAPGPVREPAPPPVTQPAARPAATASPPPAPVLTEEPATPASDAEPQVREEREPFTLPPLPGVLAAVVTGVVVGLVVVLLAALSGQACEAIRGTSSCGGAAGFLLLAATGILVTYLGGWALRAWQVSDPLSTSFLAVGIMAVLAMIFFVDALFSPWMAVVLPVLGAGAYALSWWVTTRVVDLD